MPDIIKVLIFATVAYIYLFIIAKLLGKKQIAQLTFLDYVVGITIGSIAGEMATETEQPFYHFLIAMGIFFLLDYVVTLLSRKSAFMKKLINGKPLILINEGEIDYAELEKSKLTVEELCGLARDKDYFDLKDIAFAIFETNGCLSVMPKANQTPVVAENIDVELPEPSLIEYLVIDGKMCKDTLAEQGHDKEWLYNELGITDKKDIRNILYAYYDDELGEYQIEYKQKQE